MTPHVPPGPTRPGERSAAGRSGPRFRRIEVVVNVASGGVGEGAPAELEKIFADFGLPARVRAPAPEGLANSMRAAIDAAPDLLVVLAGDGTIRTAAELCGPAGPVLAPLPGGTVNLLPRALYGAHSWQDALTIALAEGEPRMLGGGEVEGHVFLCGSIIGAPALWAPAREAVRYGQLRLAWLRGRRAMRRAFTGRLRYALDGGPRRKAGALSIVGPLVSRALPGDASALEVAALDFQGAADVVGLGLHALVDDWRKAGAVEEVVVARSVRVWAAEPIPAILDGESVRLPASAEMRYRPDVVRALVLPEEFRA
jgi:diacylglycerol kinase family enzyme